MIQQIASKIQIKSLKNKKNKFIYFRKKTTTSNTENSEKILKIQKCFFAFVLGANKCTKKYSKIAKNYEK